MRRRKGSFLGERKENDKKVSWFFFQLWNTYCVLIPTMNRKQFCEKLKISFSFMGPFDRRVRKPMPPVYFFIKLSCINNSCSSQYIGKICHIQELYQRSHFIILHYITLSINLSHVMTHYVNILLQAGKIPRMLSKFEPDKCKQIT